jgi:hypothetical protein
MSLKSYAQAVLLTPNLALFLIHLNFGGTGTILRKKVLHVGRLGGSQNWTVYCLVRGTGILNSIRRFSKDLSFLIHAT